jgi:hypothetical protein
MDWFAPQLIKAIIRGDAKAPTLLPRLQLEQGHQIQLQL